VGRDIPDDVRRFVAAHIDSVSMLDVLLLLRAAPEKVWSVPETARALVSTDAMALTNLQRLRAEGLAAAESDGFRYAPGREAEAVESLADCYARRRHTVIALIYGSDLRQATTLADAFSLRRKTR
jgi:hypothetical protein